MLKEDLLYLLEKNKGKVVSGGELSRQLNVSRNAIWKAIKVLRQEGSKIESLPNSGYLLLEDSDGLSKQSISDHLTTKKIGQSMEMLKTIDSTNQYLKSLNTSLLPEGHTVISNEQTAGKGRLGRTFYSPAGEGIFLSVLLKPLIPIKEVTFLTLCAATAVCQAIEKVCGIRSEIKWVNDIFYQGKKLCGILTEGSVSAEMGTLDYVIIGIGINTGKIPEEVEQIATSLSLENQEQGIRNGLTAEVLNQLESIYHTFLNGEKQEILDSYSERLFILGQTVTIRMPEKSYQGTVMGLNDSGQLLVKDGDGNIHTVIAGEILLEGEKTHEPSKTRN